MAGSYLRQIDVFDPSEYPDSSVVLIGVGGIGSPTGLCLSKMGITNLHVFDDDVVEEHNLPNQMYREQDLNTLKVEALKNICNDFSDTVVTTYNEKYSGQQFPRSVVISGVDSMETRINIWPFIRDTLNSQLYIDARMGAQEGMIITVDPKKPLDRKFYESTLYADDEAVEDPCTNRAIIYNTFVMAGFIASQVRKFFRKEELVKEIIFSVASYETLTGA